jgi:hypothetical protein
MKSFLIITLLILISLTGKTQNLVGYTSREITNYMKENRDDMGLEKVTNSRYKYLKYTDSFGNQTLFFFLNSDSVCKSVRLVCDLNLKNEKIREFNGTFKRTGETTWVDTRDGKDYHIKMEDDKWFITFSIEPAK